MGIYAPTMQFDNSFISLIVTALAIAINLLLGLIVYVNNRRSTTTKIFGLLNVVLALYLLANFLSIIRTDYYEKLIWVRLTICAAVLLGTTFHYFIRVFPEKTIKISLTEKLTSFLITTGVATLTLTPYIFSGLIITDPKGVPTPIVESGIIIFGITVFIYTLSGIFLLVKKYIYATELAKNQIRLLLIGTGVMFLAFLLLNFIAVVALKTTFFINFTPIYTSIFIIFAAYAIVKHHLFNVKVIATELLTFGLWLLLLVRTVTANSIGDQIISILVLSGAIVTGILLIRSVLQEVKMREKMTLLAADLEITNKELKMLDEAKSDFISIASHQLRTPLSIIKGYMSMIREGTYGKVDPKLDDPIHKVYVSNERLINLVSDLLDLSRMERGKMQYEFVPVRLGEVAEGLVLDFEKVATDKGLKFTWLKVKGSDLVKGDANKLRQIILNLIDNAIKYTSAGGLTIGIEEVPGRRTRFYVTDTGPGLTPEEVHALFQKFSRGQSEKTIHTEGLGLGLYVAKLIAQAHGGDLSVTSPGKGKGSTFSLTLPIYSEATENFTKFTSEI